MSLQAIETRSIEDSLSHANDAMNRAQRLASLLMSDLTGGNIAEATANEGPYDGLVGGADRLAGRLEALCSDLERVRVRLISNSPKNVPQAFETYASGGSTMLR
jgi:hypothetical protein